MDRAPGAATFRTSADAYDRLVGRYSPALARELIRVAGVPEGARALDVGCGPGALTKALAERLGPGNVAAVDPSAPFVAACADRVPGADVREAAAEELPFADGAFTAVLSQLVVNFMRDAPAGVTEMRRVAAPGGVVASCVWDYRDGMTLLRQFWDAALSVDPEGAAERNEGRVMPFCSRGDLAALWQQAGLTDVDTGELVVEASYEDFADLWAPLELGVAPSGAYAKALPADMRAALREELHRRLGAPHGPFTLSARAWWVSGRR